MQADDETSITELSFLPDGRICVFGMSREVLDLLGELALGDPALARRYEQMRRSKAGDATAATQHEAAKPACRGGKSR